MVKKDAGTGFTPVPGIFFFLKYIFTNDNSNRYILMKHKTTILNNIITALN
jgi:hypothetical protein